MYKICHTEQSSQRQRELEDGLLDAMSRQSYAKITLTDLCQSLSVPRKTFYRYFPTKEDCLFSLIDHKLSDCNDIVLKEWNGGTALDREVQLRFFSYWKSQTPFLDAVRDNGFNCLLLDRTTVIVDRMKENTAHDSFARNQVEYFVAHGLMTTVLRWHYFGYRSTAEEMADVFGGILENADISLHRLLL